MEQLKKDTVPAAILVLSSFAYETAKKIRDSLPQSILYSLAGRVPENDKEYKKFTEFIQAIYKDGRPIIALCATGIVIRALAPVLSQKWAEPPVIAVSEDGSCTVPLLGVTCGANRLAEQLARTLHCLAAITTSGALRFGINLLCPPGDLSLLNPENGKSFVSALLNGATARIEGEHPWLENTRLPLADKADLVIRIVSCADALVAAKANELVYRRTAHPAKGRVSIIGIGPGSPSLRTFSAEHALRQADDILGYDYYIDLAGPYGSHQTIYKSSNRQELDRARHALQLAARGRRAALVSSGDPGIYAMAAAVFEIWEQMSKTQAGNIEIVVESGISAAFAAAARFGAPLGHDFAVISLSDNLKAWQVIEKRLRQTSKADMVLALYNPLSRTRSRPFEKAVEVLRQERAPDTIIGLAQDVTRKGEVLQITTLKHLSFQDVTSRTVILIGSSRTRHFRKNQRDWIYTPRSYLET